MQLAYFGTTWILSHLRKDLEREMGAAHSAAAVESRRERSPEGEETGNRLQTGLLWLWRHRELIMSKCETSHEDSHKRGRAISRVHKAQAAWACTRKP